MGVFEIFGKAIDKVQEMYSVEMQDTQPDKEAYHNNTTGGTYRPLFSIPFDGEKNLGEIGPIKEYLLQYDLLRLRSWQSYLESEITQTVIGKFTRWVIGSGLKLQSEPNKAILEEEGINIDLKKFTNSVEARFNLFAKSKRSDYCGKDSLNKLESIAFLNAKIGGDCLVIMDAVKGEVKVRLVDGEFVKSPMYGTDYHPMVLKNGNTIRNGIELSPKGEHVAYYVQESITDKPKRVKATVNGVRRAFLLYGLRYRLDNHRGIPLISAVLETLKKLERYKEATVGSAEERQKIALQIVHGQNSTGENPFQGQLAKVADADARNLDIPVDISGKKLADTVAATTNKQVINNTPDSKVEALESKNELYFKDFYSVNIDLVCACLNIPPDVAMSMYNSSFSASRAALKDWEHTLLVERNDFREGFLQYVYDFWFEVNVHKMKISAPGYLTSNNEDVKEAYRSCRFVGANVPHIDPLKEVNAERAKLGDTGANIPLTTAEMATEALNGGDSMSNMEKYSEELKRAEELGIKAQEPEPPEGDEGDESPD